MGECMGYMRFVDQESGRIFHINSVTGEAKEYYNMDVEVGSRIITPDEQKRQKDAKAEREQRDLMKLWGREKREKFVFVNSAIDFSNVPPAMVTRLIYLSTFAAYAKANKDGMTFDKSMGTPLVRNGEHLQRKHLAEVLGISERHAVNFVKSVCPQFVCEDETGGLYLVKGFFARGGLKKKQFVQYQRLYNKGVRRLYEAAKGKYHAQLGYVFMMIPYISIEYNILCWDPMQAEMEKIRPMTPKEFCSRIGYSIANLNRLMNTYQSIMFDVNGKQEHFCKFMCEWNKQKDAIICVNPAVIYAGTEAHRLDIMKLFFNENPVA